MLNKIFLQGRLVADPELRHTSTGTAVASFSLAVERDFRDKASGQKTTDFIDVVAWRQTGEFVNLTGHLDNENGTLAVLLNFVKTDDCSFDFHFESLLKI